MIWAGIKVASSVEFFDSIQLASERWCDVFVNHCCYIWKCNGYVAPWSGVVASLWNCKSLSLC